MFFVSELVLFWLFFDLFFLPLANEASKQERWHDMVGMLINTNVVFVMVCASLAAWDGASSW